MNPQTVFGELAGIKLLDHKGACINCVGGADAWLKWQQNCEAWQMSGVSRDIVPQEWDTPIQLC